MFPGFHGFTAVFLGNMHEQSWYAFQKYWSEFLIGFGFPIASEQLGDIHRRRYMEELPLYYPTIRMLVELKTKV